MESIRRHTARLAENPPGEEEMNRMRGYVYGGSLLRLEKAGGLTASLVGMERHGLGIDYLRRLPSLLEEVTPLDISAAFSRVTNSGPQATILVGPSQSPSEGDVFRS
ncbi:MAG: hypothetical protein R6U92_03080 [Bacillota bacterium]